jgi:hypothetical protein
MKLERILNELSSTTAQNKQKYQFYFLVKVLAQKAQSH